MNLATAFFEFVGYSIVALAIRHSLKANGKKYTISFFIPIFFLVSLIEGIAVSVFNGYYYPNYSIYLFHVPLAVLLGWCAIVYAVQHASKKILDRKGTLIKISFFAAAFGMAIDLILEPLANIWNLWVWNRPGIYFNASFENFISWFFIIFAFVAVFNHASGTITNFYKRLAVLHISAAAIVAALILLISVWKATINL